jgi:hypothetical protein
MRSYSRLSPTFARPIDNFPDVSLLWSSNPLPSASGGYPTRCPSCAQRAAGRRGIHAVNFRSLAKAGASWSGMPFVVLAASPVQVGGLHRATSRLVARRRPVMPSPRLPTRDCQPYRCDPGAARPLAWCYADLAQRPAASSSRGCRRQYSSNAAQGW